MRLDILKALNEERAARRAAIVVTNQDSGAQRLVTAKDVATDPLKNLLEKHLRTGKSGIEETPEGKVFLTVHVPSPKLVITGAVHISQALAPMGQLLGYDVTIVDPRTAFASVERFPDVKVIAEWPDVALPPIGIDRYTAFVALTHDPKIDDPGLDARAQERLLLHRRARLAENPCPPRRAPEGGARLHRQRDRPHPFADRSRHRRGVAGRDRGRDHRRDHRAAAAGGSRHEVRPRLAARGARRHRRAHHPAGRAGAQEGHADRAEPRSQALEAAGHSAYRRGAARAGRRLGGRGRGRRSRQPSPGRACASTAPSPAAPICSPSTPAFWWSTRTAIDRLNRVDEAITFATLPAFKPVVAGEMIATVKIIPFAVADTRAQRGACDCRAKSFIRVAPYKMQEGRRHLDAAAGARRQGGRQDAEDHAGAAGAGRRAHRRRAPRAARAGARWPRRSTRC